MSKTSKAYAQGDLKRKEQEEREAFFEAFQKETDRGLAIASVCYLDDMLEKLIRAAYRKDPRIKILFKDNQILQSFYNKVCIAYFSGLIPEAVYDDLKLVGEIRNKFAHSVLETVSLSDVSITQKIDKLKQLSPDAKEEYPPRFAFLLIVVHMGSLLRGYREGLLELGIMKIGGMINTDVATLQGCILTPLEIKELMKRVSEESEDFHRKRTQSTL
jgi:DNA-binding MltR family transcriptional regulator